MTDRAKQLMGELFKEMTGGKSPAAGSPPTGVTRQNLNAWRDNCAIIVAGAVTEEEFQSPEGLRVGDAFYKELLDAEVNAYTAKGLSPNDPMDWQDVRDTYHVYLALTLNAISPEGIAKRKAAMKAAEEANVATPTLNAMKTDIPETVLKVPTDAQLVS